MDFSLDFYWILFDFSGFSVFEWVLMSFNGFYWVLWV